MSCRTLHVTDWQQLSGRRMKTKVDLLKLKHRVNIRDAMVQSSSKRRWLEFTSELFAQYAPVGYDQKRDYGCQRTRLGGCGRWFESLDWRLSFDVHSWLVFERLYPYTFFRKYIHQRHNFDESRTFQRKIKSSPLSCWLQAVKKNWNSRIQGGYSESRLFFRPGRIAVTKQPKVIEWKVWPDFDCSYVLKLQRRFYLQPSPRYWFFLEASGNFFQRRFSHA